MASELPRKPLESPQSLFQRVKRPIQRSPFLLFGLPFVGGIVGMSFLLSRFTQTRYDHAEAKVQTMDAEEALALRADRRRVDIREEYYRLQQGLQQTREWEQKRIERLPGQAEWGTAPPEQFVDAPNSRWQVAPDTQTKERIL